MHNRGHMEIRKLSGDVATAMAAGRRQWAGCVLTGAEECVTFGGGGDGRQLVDHLRDEGAHLSRARIRVRARVRARIRARVRVRVRVRRPALGQVPYE